MILVSGFGETFFYFGKSLAFSKDPLDVNEITGIIYYCPQSKRDLKSRLSEQKRAIKYQRPEKSALCEHSITI